MKIIKIQKGRDIPLKGAAEEKIVSLPLPQTVAVQPPDFHGLRLRPVVRIKDKVLVGSPLLEDKTDSRIKVVSPVSGIVSEIYRGEKRALLRVAVQCDGQQKALRFSRYSLKDISALSSKNIIGQLLAGGLWPFLRQRPFARTARPEDCVKAVFVQAHITEPLAPNLDFLLQGKEEAFQLGLDILKKLTSGKVFVCCSPQARSQALTEAKGVEVFGFSGPHPAGNVSTHIHCLDPVRKGDVVWYLGAEDVLRIADMFSQGQFNPQRTVAVTGEGASTRLYYQTVLGVPLRHLLMDPFLDEQRFLSGSVLRGTDVGPDGYVCFYDQQITLLPRGGKREFMGWLHPGWNKYSFSRTFLSSLQKRHPERHVSLDTDYHGGHRAIVLNHIYDDYVPLDILPYFLVRAILSGDLEEAERLGLLECVEEDFALCSFACPSKFDVGGVIRRGLRMLEEEG